MCDQCNAAKLHFLDSKMFACSAHSAQIVSEMTASVEALNDELQARDKWCDMSTVSFDETAIVYIYCPKTDDTMMVKMDLNYEMKTIIDQCVDYYLQRGKSHNTLSSLVNEKCDAFGDEFHQETNESTSQADGSGRSCWITSKVGEEANAEILMTDVGDSEKYYDDYMFQHEEYQYGLDGLCKQVLSWMMPCIPVHVMFLVAVIWWCVNHYGCIKRLWQLIWCFINFCHFSKCWNTLYVFQLKSSSYLQQRKLPAKRKYRETRREVGEEDARTRPKESLNSAQIKTVTE